MMIRSLLPRTATTLLLGATLATASAVAQADNRYYYSSERAYSVTVTNITKAVQFTPILAASHTRAIALFEPGQPASTPLAILAEDGAVGPLREVLDASPAVADTYAGSGLLNAGDSVTFEITSERRVLNLSMAAMLLPTNDSFVALDSVRLPRRGTLVYRAGAYDAGSEPNDEICANIPGPTCGGVGRSEDDSNAEGFVHVANGIHGISGELSPALYDWRDAVAEVTITRIR